MSTTRLGPHRLFGIDIKIGIMTALNCDAIMNGCHHISCDEFMGGRKIGGLRRSNSKWECNCGVLLLGKKSVTPVEDGKPLNPATAETSKSYHIGFHRDLNSLPSMFLDFDS